MPRTQNSPFDQPEKVLHGASQMAVAELAAEPRVREFVRDVFQETAVISTGVCLPFGQPTKWQWLYTCLL